MRNQKGKKEVTPRSNWDEILKVIHSQMPKQHDKNGNETPICNFAPGALCLSPLRSKIIDLACGNDQLDENIIKIMKHETEKAS